MYVSRKYLSGKYNPPLKHSLRHHFLKAEKATFDRLTVLENELQKKEMDLTCEFVSVPNYANW